MYLNITKEESTYFDDEILANYEEDEKEEIWDGLDW